MSLADALRSNWTIEELEVSGQMQQKGGAAVLGASESEKVLVSAIENTLKRRKEARVCPFC